MLIQTFDLATFQRERCMRDISSLRKTALQNCLTIRNIRCCYRVDLQNCLETQTMATDTVKIYWFNLLLTGASSFMSLFGGFVIVLSYVRLRQIRNFTRTLLLYLTIADLMTATGNLVATIRYGIVHSSHSVEDNWVQNCSEQASKAVYRPVCVGQSFVTTFSNMASFFWTAIIALHIWISVTFRSKKAEMTCAHIFFHVISWCVPLGIVTYLLIKGYLGEDTCYGTGVWCGIRSGLPRHMVEMLMYIADVGWQLLCYILATLFYIHIKFCLWLKRRYAPSIEFRKLADNLRNDDKNFLMVVLVIYALKLWGMIRFFITTYVDEQTLASDVTLRNVLTFLLFMQSYGASGQAFWNFILFCIWDKEVRTAMFRKRDIKQLEELTESHCIQDGGSSSETETLISSEKGSRFKNSYM